MALRGAAYREHRTYTIAGEEIEIPLKPIIDEEYLGLIFRLDVDPEDVEAVTEAAKAQEEGEKPDDADADLPADDESEDEEEEPEIPDVDPVVMAGVLQDACLMGVDYEALGETKEGWTELVKTVFVGGLTLELGADVMRVSDGVADAEKFRR